MIKLSRYTAFVLLISALTLHSVQAKEMTVDLSSSIVQITTGFSGAELLLFGVAPEDGDVVIVIRGPQEQLIVRKKERLFGIWVNQDQFTFKDIPSFYAMASNRPLDQFLPGSIAAIQQIGIPNLDLAAVNPDEIEKVQGHYRHALIRNKQRQNLYKWKPEPLIFLGSGLFRTTLRFPSNVSVGTYGIDVHLIRKGELISSETTLMHVRKFGIEAGIYDFAHRYSLAYGIFAIIIASFAGWAANAAFRKS